MEVHGLPVKRRQLLLHRPSMIHAPSALCTIRVQSMRAKRATAAGGDDIANPGVCCKPELGGAVEPVRRLQPAYAREVLRIVGYQG